MESLQTFYNVSSFITKLYFPLSSSLSSVLKVNFALNIIVAATNTSFVEDLNFCLIMPANENRVYFMCWLGGRIIHNIAVGILVEAPVHNIDRMCFSIAFYSNTPGELFG